MIGKKLFSVFLIAAIGLSALLASSLTSAQGVPQATTEKQQSTVLQIAEGTPELSTFVSLLERANMTGPLNDTTANYTLLAPDNAAFANLSNYSRAAYIENTTNLRDVLFNHIVQGTVNFTQNGTLTTLAHQNFSYTVNGSKVTFDNGWPFTKVTQANITGINGVIYVIDGVLTFKPGAVAGTRVAPAEWPTAVSPTAGSAAASQSSERVHVPGFEVLFGVGVLMAVAASRYATRLRKQ